ncbi:MAG: tetraacyldisaccharide 4'-kinase [Ferruginibacter sp.]|nr:tetraacyldisaccharide 4'-kinase [Ferruginibacter sp.]HAZ93439.1 tetraacyldisaccharide 4'-kinase [Chitinophagaceae bacterium]
MKKVKTILFPISLVYGFILKIRHWLYDKNILKSSSFNFPVICIGNLATGGTGKTPMTEYLVDMLKGHYKVATLSRGYKRKTSGFAIANENSTAIEIGDEPMQFHEKYKDITVAVGEERLVAIPQLLHDRPDTEVILLDDAFQHRQVNAGLNILLTDYRNLFSKDLLLPAGNLRDIRSAAKRAQILIVTKCKTDLSKEEKKEIINDLSAGENQCIYFSETVYGIPYHLFTKATGNINYNSPALLVTGIAKTMYLESFLKKQVCNIEMLRFADHHIFDLDDLVNICKKFEALPGNGKVIFTTEKDGVRLKKFKKELGNYPIYVLPIKHHFLFYEGQKFEDQVLQFINSFYRHKPAE